MSRSQVSLPRCKEKLGKLEVEERWVVVCQAMTAALGMQKGDSESEGLRCLRVLL